jgi:CRP/FNR family cyclic AMP-dependent transcriptional regulator
MGNSDPQSRRICKSKQRGKLLHFEAGDVLYSPTQPCRRLYLLRSGEVQLSGDREAILDHLRAGQIFGEKCLLGPDPGKQAARAVTPVEVATLRKSEVFSALRQDHRFAEQLLKNLAIRMDRYEHTIRDFVAEAAEYRLACLLLRLAPARPASGWVRFRYSPTNAELARMIGTTRWRVSHFMSRFQKLGWLRRDRGLWVHRQGLREYVQTGSGRGD